jgi:hypothetical protein
LSVVKRLNIVLFVFKRKVLVLLDEFDVLRQFIAGARPSSRLRVSCISGIAFPLWRVG